MWIFTVDQLVSKVSDMESVMTRINSQLARDVQFFQIIGTRRKEIEQKERVQEKHYNLKRIMRMCVHNPLKVIDILSTHNMFNFVHVPMHGLFINMLNPTGILRTLSAFYKPKVNVYYWMDFNQTYIMSSV